MKTKLKKDNFVIIIGAGEIGWAIEKILKNKSDFRVELWDKKRDSISGQKPLKEIVCSADFLFLAVPSWSVSQVLGSIASYLNKKTIVVCLSKGIEEKTLKTMDLLLKELLPKKQLFAILTGPMLAEELVQGLFGIGVVGTKNRKVFGALKKLFAQTNLQIEYSSDIHGLALAGALKNVYALGLGIAKTFNLGENFNGWFIQRAALEMAEIIETLGGRRQTGFGLAGLADLIATGLSSYSHNREIGQKLAKTGKFPKVDSEGIISLFCIVKLLKNKGFDKRFILLQVLRKIIAQPEKAKTIFAKLG